MRVAVEKMSGVESADVSLEDGLATVRLAPDNRVSLEEIRERVRSNGFTPKEAEVRIAGRIAESADGPVLEVPSIDREYRLMEPADVGAAAAAIGQRVILRGRVPGSTKERPAVQLEVLEVESAAPGDATPGPEAGSG